jgi:hypothetical protein
MFYWVRQVFGDELKPLFSGFNLLKKKTRESIEIEESEINTRNRPAVGVKLRGSQIKIDFVLCLSSITMKREREL